MLTRLQFLSLSIVLLTLTACSGSNSNGNGGGSPGASANSPEEALAQLSPERRQEFDTWKVQLIKTCEAHAIFPDVSQLPPGREPSNGVDLNVLLQKTENSLLLRGRSGEFALLGEPKFMGGQENSQFTYSRQANGRGEKIDVRATRNGRTCEVYLFGAKVHELTLAASVSVLAESTLHPSTPIGEIDSPKILHHSNGVIEISQHKFAEVVTTGIVSFTAEDAAMPAAYFKLDGNDAKKYFPKDFNSNYFAVSLRPTEETDGIWFDAKTQLLTRDNKIEDAIKNNANTIRFDARTRFPHWEFGKLTNTADPLNFSFQAQITVSPAAAQPGQAQFTLSGLRLDTESTESSPSNSAALRCATQRTQALLRVTEDRARNQFFPTAFEALAPCAKMSVDLDAALQSSGTYTKLLPKVFGSVTGEKSLIYYLDWWPIIQTVSRAAFNKVDSDILLEMDPHQEAPVLVAVARYLTEFRRNLQYIPKSNGFVYGIVEAAETWGLTGKSVDPSRIAMISRAVQKSALAFNNSTTKLLGDLAKDPKSGNRELEFADQLESEYVNEAIKVTQIANELNYVEWFNTILDQVLQTRPSIYTFQATHEKLGAILNAYQKHPGIKPLIYRLVYSSLRWLERRDVTAEQIEGIFSAIENVKDAFPESTQNLVSQIDLSVEGQRVALDFAAHVTEEYKKLAASIAARANRLDQLAWAQGKFNTLLQTRPNLGQLQAWDETLASAEKFSQNEISRLGGQDNYQTQGNRKSLFRVAIDQGWQSNEYSELEAVAEFGHLDLNCKYYRDASSIAQCFGLSHFGRQKGQIFDSTRPFRYGAFTKIYADYIEKISPRNFTFGYQLESSYLPVGNVLWSNCDSTQFGAKQQALRQKLDAWLKESEFNRQYAIQLQVAELLNNCI